MAYSHKTGPGPGLVQGTGLAQKEAMGLVPVLAPDQYEHFCIIYEDPFLVPVPVPCSVNKPLQGLLSLLTFPS